MSALGTALGGLDVDLGMTRQEAERLTGRRHGHAKRRARQDLTIRAIAHAHPFRIHFGFIGDLTAMARAV